MGTDTARAKIALCIPAGMIVFNDILDNTSRYANCVKSNRAISDLNTTPAKTKRSIPTLGLLPPVAGRNSVNAKVATYKSVFS